MTRYRIYCLEYRRQRNIGRNPFAAAWRAIAWAFDPPPF